MHSGLGIAELWSVGAFQTGEGGLNQDACILTGVGEGDGLCRMILRFVGLKGIGANIYPQSGTCGLLLPELAGGAYRIDADGFCKILPQIGGK